jgi:NAD(P)-dependent dehydrogenase (short-subunit alcohol dehydrogenase family)
MNMVITGATSGIGKALYDYYSASWDDTSEYRVRGVGLNGPDIKVDFRAALGDLLGKRISSTVMTLRDYSPIDVFINNAGIFKLDELNKPFSYLDLVDINLVAPYIFMMMVPALMPRGSVIINIGSISGIRGEADAPMYGATKAGIINLTKSFARRLATQGIRVNCISPGFFRTNLIGSEDEPLPQELRDTIPMDREAEPEELISVVEAIIKCEYMTGTNIVVDGGAMT